MHIRLLGRISPDSDLDNDAPTGSLSRWGPDPPPMRTLARKHARCSKPWGRGSFILRVRTFAQQLLIQCL
jgi:hypothetical protein